MASNGSDDGPKTPRRAIRLDEPEDLDGFPIEQKIEGLYAYYKNLRMVMNAILEDFTGLAEGHGRLAGDVARVARSQIKDLVRDAVLVPKAQFDALNRRLDEMEIKIEEGNAKLLVDLVGLLSGHTHQENVLSQHSIRTKELATEVSGVKETLAIITKRDATAGGIGAGIFAFVAAAVRFGPELLRDLLHLFGG